MCEAGCPHSISLGSSAVSFVAFAQVYSSSVRYLFFPSFRRRMPLMTDGTQHHVSSLHLSFFSWRSATLKKRFWLIFGFLTCLWREKRRSLVFLLCHGAGNSPSYVVYREVWLLRLPYAVRFCVESWRWGGFFAPHPTSPSPWFLGSVRLERALARKKLPRLPNFSLA